MQRYMMTIPPSSSWEEGAPKGGAVCLEKCETDRIAVTFTCDDQALRIDLSRITARKLADVLQLFSEA